MTTTSTSIEWIYPTLVRIHEPGQAPTRAKVIELKKQAYANARAVPAEYNDHGLGYFGAIAPPNEYEQRSPGNAPHVPPPQQPPVPVYPAGATGPQRTPIKREHEARRGYRSLFKRRMNLLELKWWLQSFQADFDELAESDHLQFEMVVWNPDGERNLRPVRGTPITVEESRAFPFLYVEMSWTASDELRFDVHKKEEYHLQYIDGQSTHSSTMKASVHKGVLHQLATLTTMSPDNADRPLDSLRSKLTVVLRSS